MYNSSRTKSPVTAASTTLQSRGPAETNKQKIEDHVAIKEISICLTDEHVNELCTHLNSCTAQGSKWNVALTGRTN